MEISQSSAVRAAARPAGPVNVGRRERTLSVLVGGFVLLHAVSRLSLSTLIAAAAGGALLYRGVTGHCCAYEALDISPATSEGCREAGVRQLPDQSARDEQSRVANGALPAATSR